MKLLCKANIHDDIGYIYIIYSNGTDKILYFDRRSILDKLENIKKYVINRLPCSGINVTRIPLELNQSSIDLIIQKQFRRKEPIDTTLE